MLCLQVTITVGGEGVSEGGGEREKCERPRFPTISLEWIQIGGNGMGQDQFMEGSSTSRMTKYQTSFYLIYSLPFTKLTLFNCQTAYVSSRYLYFQQHL